MRRQGSSGERAQTSAVGRRKEEAVVLALIHVEQSPERSHFIARTSRCHQRARHGRTNSGPAIVAP
jgi:hypothetical protein